MSKKQLIATKLQRQQSECIQSHLGGIDHQNVEYQRVMITETSEETEGDTIFSCQMLHKCMNLRKKWIENLDAVQILKREAGMPSIMRIEEGVSEEDVDLPPVTYNVLHRQPTIATSDFTFQMSEGVIFLYDSISSERVFPVPSFSDFVRDYLSVSRLLITMIHS